MITISISNSALSSSGCILAFKRTVIDGYKEPASSSNIVYGEAVHKYIDMMFKTNEHIPTAIAAATRVFNQPKVSKNRSPHLDDQRHMIATAFDVWERYVKEDTGFSLLMLDLPCWCCGGKGKQIVPIQSEIVLGDQEIDCQWCKGAGHYIRPATELTFSIPYYKDEFIEVNLEGTIDSIGKVNGGIPAIRDWKTTSTWDREGYFYPYRLSKQLRFYGLALKLMAEREPTSALGMIGANAFGAIIDAIFIKPSVNDNRCLRSEVFTYSDKEFSDFRNTLDNFIGRLSDHVSKNYFPKEGIIKNACEKKYGLCPFFTVCSVNDEVANVLLKRDFKQTKYNPLNYSGLCF